MSVSLVKSYVPAFVPARWFGAWHGGANYSPTDVSVRADLLEFDTVADARLEFWLRLVNRDGQTPCVTDDAEMHLYRADPSDQRDPYPDRRVFIGPRGGIRVERV